LVNSGDIFVKNPKMEQFGAVHHEILSVYKNSSTKNQNMNLMVYFLLESPCTFCGNCAG